MDTSQLGHGQEQRQSRGTVRQGAGSRGKSEQDQKQEQVDLCEKDRLLYESGQAHSVESKHTTSTPPVEFRSLLIVS
jgi:hypothetical protein